MIENFSSSLAEMLSKDQKQSNQTNDGTALLDRIGLIGAKRLRQELLDDAIDKSTSANFDILRILTEMYHTCKDKMAKGDGSFAFSFLRCALEDTVELKEIWRKYDDGINLKLLNMAFTMCAGVGGYLPIFNTPVEFETLFNAFQGSSQPILWGEVDKVGNDLFWCHGGAKLPKEPTVNGTTYVPFFLVSLAEKAPNLYAIPLNTTTLIYLEKVACLHDKDILDKCNAGNRTKELTALENLLKKYGI